jgi:D-tyrosyl-tRNA(Tyr) deacylase
VKAVIQRVSSASVVVDNKTVSSIDAGFLIFLGVTHDDTLKDVEILVKKIINMRIFCDENGKMNLPITSVNGKIIVVSQFTLHADCTHGNRPSFINAAKKDLAEHLYNKFIEEINKAGINAYGGIFAADMKINLVNNGPVTIIIDSENLTKK